jgi:multicomponent Na+:H+ antiporter subunit D
MREQLPALIVVVPLAMAVLAPLFAYFSKGLMKTLSIGALIFANIGAVDILMRVLKNGTWHYHFGNWAPPWGIEYVIDPLSGIMAVMVTFVAMFVLIYAGPYVKEDHWLKKGVFYTLYLLLAAG